MVLIWEPWTGGTRSESLEPLELSRGPGTRTPELPSLGFFSSSQSQPLRPVRGQETGQTCPAPPPTLGNTPPRSWAPPFPALVLSLSPVPKERWARTVTPRGRTSRLLETPSAGTVLSAPMAPPTGAMASAGNRARTVPFRGVGLWVRTAPPRGARGCIQTAASLRRGTRVQLSPLPPNRVSNLTEMPWVVTPKLTTEVRGRGD